MTPLYPQKLALTSPTGGGRSVGIVRSRTKATEFSFSTSGWFIIKKFVTMQCHMNVKRKGKITVIGGWKSGLLRAEEGGNDSWYNLAADISFFLSLTSSTYSLLSLQGCGCI